MTKNNSKAFNTFAQKIKKHNKEAQDDIERYKKVSSTRCDRRPFLIGALMGWLQQDPSSFNKATVKGEEGSDEDDEEDLDDLAAIAKPKKLALSDEEEDEGAHLFLLSTNNDRYSA